MEAKYRILFEQTTDAILETDIHGIILDMNENVQRRFGHKVSDWKGKPFQSFFHLTPDVKVDSEWVLRKVHSERKTRSGIYNLFCKKDDSHAVNVTSVPVIEHNHVQSILHIIRHTSDHREKARHSKAVDRVAMGFENATEAVVYIDKDYKIIDFNRKMLNLFGYSREDVLGQAFTVFPFFNPVDMQKMMRAIDRSRMGELPPVLYFEGYHADGAKFQIEINSTTVIEDGVLAGFLIIFKDITQQKKKEAERARLIDILEATPDFIASFDGKGNISYINRAGRRMIGLGKDDDVSKMCFTDYHPKSAIRKLIDEALPAAVINGIWKGETKLLADGKEIPTSQVVMAHRNDKNEILFISTILRDVSELKQNEKHIQKLTQQLIKIQETERMRISRDLHDNLAQDLLSLKISCETLFDHHTNISESIQRKMRCISGSLQRSISDIRDLTYNLRPTTLDQFGLMQTVKQYCDEFSKRNVVKVNFHSAGMENVRLDFDTEINLYRIAQEGLNNVRKHSTATSAIVRLVASHPMIILQIEDNGCGFDVGVRKTQLLKEKRMGLRSIEERVGLLNGSLRIQSKRDLGTRIHIEVPYTDIKRKKK